MREIDWKNKLRKLREAAKEAAAEDSTEEEPKVKFPWFMLITSIFGDLVGWFNIGLSLLTAGVWLAISETIGNIIETVINISHYVWYKYFSSTGISPIQKNKIATKLITNKIITILFGWIPVIGDAVPKLTISTFVHYFVQKAESKLGIKIPTKLSKTTA